MKNFPVFTLALLLLLASLACGRSIPLGTSDNKTGNGSSGYDTEFPLPENIGNFSDLGNDEINFQTKMSLEEAAAFYRDAFSKAGYSERQINTVFSDTTFNMVFDGHPSGKAIVVQCVDLGNGNLNINIRFEDI